MISTCVFPNGTYDTLIVVCATPLRHYFCNYMFGALVVLTGLCGHAFLRHTLFTHDVFAWEV